MNNNNPVDQESKRLWRELSAYDEINNCCAIIKRSIIKFNAGCMVADHRGMILGIVKLNYCPECGRKIE